MTGIEISQEDAANENLPDDLNSLAYGAYRLPDLSRRRFFAIILLIFCLVSISLIFFSNQNIFIYPSVIFFIIFIYIFLLDHHISVQQKEVIENAAQHIDHSVGYYSVGLTFRNFILNPVWTVIIYDHNNPPIARSIIEIDANSSKLIGEVYKEKL